VTGVGAGLARAAEEQAICNVRRRWAFARDQGEWEALRGCFHPDATITVAWYSGPAAGFVERSIAMAAHRRAEEHHKHWLGNMRAEINGDRAVLETDAMVLIREYIDAHLFDYCCHLRFYDLLAKRDGVWRLSKASCIYEKDRLDPVVPSTVPASFFAAIELVRPDAGFAYMEAEQTLREEGMAWLAGE
jgi:hypothetical protein